MLQIHRSVTDLTHLKSILKEEAIDMSKILRMHENIYDFLKYKIMQTVSIKVLK